MKDLITFQFDGNRTPISSMVDCVFLHPVSPYNVSS